MNYTQLTAEKKAQIDILLDRRFIPKGSSMKNVTQYYLDNISFEINSMPRKIFDYKCAYDMELKHR